MTVVHPNAVSGINSITVQTGNSLSIHKADGSLIRTITGSTGVTTFATISVGSAYTDFAQGGGLNIGLGASISNGSGNVLTFGTGGDDRATIDASGNLVHGGGSSRSAVGGAQLVQVEGLTASAGFSAVRNSNDAHGPYISLAKSRGTALGAVTVIQDDDDLGAIRFGGGDGTDIASEGARIEATVDGTPGSNDIPTRLTFQTTADGAAAPTERLRITSGGLVGINTDTIGTNHNLEIFGNAGAYAVLNVKSQSLSHGASIELGAQDDDNYGSITQFASGASEGGRMKFVAGTTETMNLRGGNVLIGDSAGAVGKLSTLGTGNHISASRHSTDTSASNFIFAKYRGSRSSPTVVADGDDLGNLSWYGYNGSSIIKAADITAKTAGTVDGSNMTTDLTFSTTTGNTSTERLRIDSSGRLLIGSTASNQVWGLQGALQVEGLTGDTATANFISNQNSNAPFYLNFCKTRGTSDGSATVVQNGDFLGTIAFAGADGTDRECVGGRIDCIVAAAPGGNDMPGKITFSTTADGAVSPTLALTLDQSQNATFAGSVTDSKGNLRSIPRNDKTSNYTAVAGDAGKVITTDISSSGQVTINASVFSEGDALTILNYGSAAITIVQGSGMAITNCADGATGNRTLASKGMATLYFLGSTGAAISGAGIS